MARVPGLGQLGRRLLGLLRGGARRSPELLPGQVPGALQPVPYPSLTDWPDAVLETITHKQEVGYREAGRLLGLGDTPEAAYDRLREAPRKGLTPEEFRKFMGWDGILAGENCERIKAQIPKDIAAEPELPVLPLEVMRSTGLCGECR